LTRPSRSFETTTSLPIPRATLEPPREKALVLAARTERWAATRSDVLGTGPVSLGDGSDGIENGRPAAAGPRYGRAWSTSSSTKPTDVQVAHGRSHASSGFCGWAGLCLERATKAFAAGARDVIDRLDRGNPYALRRQLGDRDGARTGVLLWSWSSMPAGRATHGGPGAVGFLRAVSTARLSRPPHRAWLRSTATTYTGRRGRQLAAGGSCGRRTSFPHQWAGEGWVDPLRGLPRQVHADGGRLRGLNCLQTARR